MGGVFSIAWKFWKAVAHHKPKFERTLWCKSKLANLTVPWIKCTAHNSANVYQREKSETVKTRITAPCISARYSLWHNRYWRVKIWCSVGVYYLTTRCNYIPLAGRALNLLAVLWWHNKTQRGELWRPALPLQCSCKVTTESDNGLHSPVSLPRRHMSEAMVAPRTIKVKRKSAGLEHGENVYLLRNLLMVPA